MMHDRSVINRLIASMPAGALAAFDPPLQSRTRGGPSSAAASEPSI
jgi:hypothetical protein